MKIAIDARTEKELNAILKKYKLKLEESSIYWWLHNAVRAGRYFCTEVDLKGKQSYYNSFSKTMQGVIEDGYHILTLNNGRRRL